LRWDDDEVAQQRLAERDAFTLEEIGRMLGLGRERVRQIEERALAKLARLMGGDKDKVVESLRALSQERDQRRSAWEMMDTDS
jgi:DNA-directed RNA polymerase sigma subunit (sigma70/sigma32)